MKKKVVFFGNCQAGQLNKIISKLITSDAFSFQYYPNNARTGGQKSNEETLNGIADADYLIYQPLGKFHGVLCEENVLQRTQSSCVTVPFTYIFNSGISSLCNAPRSGKIFGSEMITGLLGEKNRDEILLDYKLGAINFDLANRFNNCLAEMRRREENAAIKLADYIEANYKYRKLFVTHNHPANALLFESVRQIKQITELPIKLDFTELGIPELPNTNCPVSPHDKLAHGYEFAADIYWFQRGKLLIDRIIDVHEAAMKPELQKNENNLNSHALE